MSELGVPLFAIDIDAGFGNGVLVDNFIDLIKADVVMVHSTSDHLAGRIKLSSAGFTFGDGGENGREVGSSDLTIGYVSNPA